MGGTCSRDSTRIVLQNGNVTKDKSQKRNSNETIRKGSRKADDKCYPKAHHQCRGGTYPREDDVLRFPVPDHKISWDVDFPDYEPIEFFAVMEVQIEEDKNFRFISFK